MQSSLEGDTSRISELLDQNEKQAERIKELEQQIARLKTVPMKYRRMEFNAQLQRENTEQAAEISRLKALVGKCKDGIEGALSDDLPYINECNEALASI